MRILWLHNLNIIYAKILEKKLPFLLRRFFLVIDLLLELLDEVFFTP